MRQEAAVDDPYRIRRWLLIEGVNPNLPLISANSASGQTANLLSLNDSNGGAKLSVDPTGLLRTKGGLWSEPSQVFQGTAGLKVGSPTTSGYMGNLQPCLELYPNTLLLSATSSQNGDFKMGIASYNEGVNTTWWYLAAINRPMAFEVRNQAYVNSKHSFWFTDSAQSSGDVVMGLNHSDAGTAEPYLACLDSTFTRKFLIDGDGGPQILTTGAKPAASSSLRGKLFFEQGGALVSDVLYVCLKDATDTYVWQAL